MAATLVVGALTQLGAAASFGYVARVLHMRGAAAQDRSAHNAFILFWIAMATFMAKSALFGLAANEGIVPIVPFMAGRFLEILVVCLAAWGLSYYVAYLHTGRTAFRVFFAVYFILVGLSYATAFADSRPTQVVVNEWRAEMLPMVPAMDLIYAAFGLPMIVAILGYLSLVARASRPLHKYRILLVSGSLLAWVGGGLAASIVGDPFWSFVGITLLGILTSIGVLLAYRPPRAWLMRLDPEEAASVIIKPTASRREFASRLRDLV